VERGEKKGKELASRASARDTPITDILPPAEINLREKREMRRRDRVHQRMFEGFGGNR